MNKPSLMLVSEAFPPTTSVGRERAWSLARYLPQHGWQITVITKEMQTKHHRYPAADYSMLNMLSNQVHIERVRQAQWIDWMQAGIYRRKVIRVMFGFPDSGRPWSNHCSRKTLTIAQVSKPDIIFTTSPNNSVHLIGMKMAQETGCKWVADFQDAWIGNRMVRKISPIHTCVSMYYYEKVLHSCDMIVANNPKLQTLITRQYPEVETKIECVPIGYDEDLYKKAQPRQLDDDSSEHVALYSGSMYNGKVLRTMEKLCKYLDQANSARVKIFTIGELPATYQPKYKSGPYSLGYVDYPDVPSYLFAADSLILFLPEVERDSARVLLKSYGYARVQRPILYIGPRNATFEYLQDRTEVEQVDLPKLWQATSWFNNLLLHKQIPLTDAPQSVLSDSFEIGSQKFSKLFYHLLRVP